VHDPDLHGAEPRQIEALVPLDGARVLEVGCGDGRLTAFVAARAASVYAFDPDADRVAAARTAQPDAEVHRVRFAVHGVEALDVERETFDVALCGWSL
jgi:ubiquinone/menaquinone biosynthesis C-methylase UbiE